MQTLKAGLLPLYIELYDTINPAWNKPLIEFAGRVANRLAALGCVIETAPVCRLESEFASAIRDLEARRVEALITLHLAYSPSLESAAPLARTRLPIIVLDTTPDFAFGPDTGPHLIMNNHGIHGVQDMCNLLLRNGKPFAIEAGHWKHSDVLQRVVEQVRAARMANAFRNARVGLVGKPFAGMGDFSVPATRLKKDLGITTIAVPPGALGRLMPAARSADVEKDLNADRLRFDCRHVNPAAHRESARVGLALQRLIDRERLSAVSLNFQEATSAGGIPVMPFLGLCKAMSRGTGYAGEGDILTATLVGSLLRAYPETSFTEMFCPDWKGGRVFLSHMGEINPAVAESRPALFTYDPWLFSEADPPVAVGACFKPGKAVFVNLAPTRGGYNLIAAPVTMVSGGRNPKFRNTVRGWMKPPVPLADFLPAYSRVGGTHHAALVYGATLPSLAAFSRMLGFEFNVIE